MKKLPRIEISKICCNKGCNRVSVVAELVGEMWITRCSACHQNPKGISLDLEKISGKPFARKAP